jgi:hypothetical protein
MVEGIRQRVMQATPAAHSDFSAVAIMERAGLPPDSWQRSLLTRSTRRTLLLCSRQSGKSTATAALCLATVMERPRALVLLVCPTERQSKELLDKALTLYRTIGEPLGRVTDSSLHLTLANGSRILALPGNEAGLRGYSGAALVVLDEAARIPDPLYYSLRPVLAVSGGALLALSTPYGKRGWFYDEYTDGGDDWQRITIKATECPRITAEFLAEEKRRLPDLVYRTEYGCEFVDTLDQFFSTDMIDAAVSDEVEPLFTLPPRIEEDVCQPLW